ncbi:MAG TPA: hypothetical protein VFZ89_19815 [Solirubrobacteraceae bacterium]
MSGTRALFASIGASVLLVAAAALSLLAVSAVFAFGGWSDPVAESGRQTALVLAVDGGGRQNAKQKPLVLPPRAATARDVSRTVRATPAAQGRARAADQAAITPATNRRPKASFTPPPPVDSPQTATQKPPPPAPKAAGDGVRSAGEGLSGTVQSTGDALAQITDPLLPPVTAATQKVLNLVAQLLRRATDGLGDTVDRVLPAK